MGARRLLLRTTVIVPRMREASDVARAKHRTEETAERAADNPWSARLARLGLVAQGTVYALVGTLALLVATHAGGRLADRKGALQMVAAEPFGRFVVVVLAVGFAGYTLWRLLVAILGRTLETREREGPLRRLGHLGRAAIYGALCVTAVLLVTGSGGGSGQEEGRATAWILDLPFGTWIVTAAGLGFLAAAAVNAYRALARKFMEQMKTRELSPGEERLVTSVGMFGYGARAVVFSLVGVFLVRAAVQYDPQEAVGLDGALRKVVQADYGPFLLGIVAAGLAAYGLFCLIEARYRSV